MHIADTSSGRSTIWLFSYSHPAKAFDAVITGTLGTSTVMTLTQDDQHSRPGTRSEGTVDDDGKSVADNQRSSSGHHCQAWSRSPMTMLRLGLE